MNPHQAEAIMRQVEGLLMQAQGLLAGLRAVPMTAQPTPPAPFVPTIHDEPELPQETGLRAAILDLLSRVERPMKGCLVARRLNRKEDSHFRTTIGRLRKEGLLTHYHQRGYWLATRPTPADIDQEQARKGA